jgi:hypothetical protein
MICDKPPHPLHPRALPPGKNRVPGEVDFQKTTPPRQEESAAWKVGRNLGEFGFHETKRLFLLLCRFLQQFFQAASKPTDSPAYEATPPVVPQQFDHTSTGQTKELLKCIGGDKHV